MRDILFRHPEPTQAEREFVTGQMRVPEAWLAESKVSSVSLREVRLTGGRLLHLPLLVTPSESTRPFLMPDFTTVRTASLWTSSPPRPSFATICNYFVGCLPRLRVNG